MEQSRLLTAPPWSPAGGRRVQSSVCGRRAQGLAGRTRRPGVAVAEGSGSSERRRRRVVAAVAARATCIDGLLRGGAPMRRLPVGNPSRVGFNCTNVLAPADGLRPRSRSSCTVFGFCYLLVWGYIADLSMVPRLRRGRLAGRALSHPFILRGQKYVIKASQSTVQRRVLSTKGQSCLSAAELVMGHPRNPTAYYLASTLLAYRRLRPKSVHTCSCRCEHKGFAVSTQLLRLHLPVKCEQRILNQRSP